MSGTIIFLSLSILFLSLMMSFKLKITLDLNNNKMIILIWVYKLKIITIDINIIGLYYKINNSKKLKPLNIILKKEDKYFLEQIKSSILDKLYYDDIIFVSKVGLNSASNTAVSVGFLDQICRYLTNILYVKNPDIRLYFNNIPNFEEVSFVLDLELKVYFTIFDLVFAIIMSFYKRGKYVKERIKER